MAPARAAVSRFLYEGYGHAGQVLALVIGDVLEGFGKVADVRFYSYFSGHTDYQGHEKQGKDDASGAVHA